MGREMPYSPMGQRKEVPESRMQEILAKHAQRLHLPPPKTQVVVENTPAPGMQPNLEWSKPEKGATAVRTVCGRYSCSKVTISGKQTYEVWRLVPDHWFKQIAVGLDSFESAKRAADEDFKQTIRAKSV